MLLQRLWATLVIPLRGWGLFKVRRSFAPLVGEYLTVAKENLLSEPYIRKRMIPIDKQKRRVDIELFPHLLEQDRATRPEEVGTVLLLDWGLQEVGRYVDVESRKSTGELAYVHTCTLSIIDWQLRTVIGRRSFVGGKPLEGEIVGPGMPPYFEIAYYLTNLPRK